MSCVKVLGFLVAKYLPVSMPGKIPDQKHEYCLEGPTHTEISLIKCVRVCILPVVRKDNLILKSRMLQRSGLGLL